ncbi:MAG: hypothetical protein KME59_12600 [Trichormus sp. ATA11-4-KO1]|jgi:hypothetical protein|nr:hypothetical protein [Trichormus sp. ATA11-4-KO1]
MNKILYHLFPRLNILTILILTFLLVSLPVAATSQPVFNDVINPREPNFFTRGREQFEREIQLLLNKSRSPVDTPLKRCVTPLPI